MGYCKHKEHVNRFIKNLGEIKFKEEKNHNYDCIFFKSNGCGFLHKREEREDIRLLLQKTNNLIKKLNIEQLRVLPQICRFNLGSS